MRDRSGTTVSGPTGHRVKYLARPDLNGHPACLQYWKAMSCTGNWVGDAAGKKYRCAVKHEGRGNKNLYYLLMPAYHYPDLRLPPARSTSWVTKEKRSEMTREGVTEILTKVYIQGGHIVSSVGRHVIGPINPPVRSRSVTSQI